MNIITKHTAVFYSAGSFFADQTRVEVNSADPEAVKFPDGAYAFVLRQHNEVEIDGVIYRSAETQSTPFTYYHPDSCLKTLDEVLADPRSGPYLASNMRVNRWDRVVYTRYGNWPQPFDPASTVILGKTAA